MIFAIPALIIPPEKPAIVRSSGLKGLTWQEVKRRERGFRESAFPFPMFCPSITQVWSTEYTWTLTTDDASSTSNNNTFRMVVPAISKNITKARITLRAPAATSNIAHASIGVHTSSGGTVATPVEILFAGASGIIMTSGSTNLSDETAFVASAGDSLIVVVDMGASNSNLRYSVNAAYNLYGKSTGSYNSSSSAGLSLNFGGLHAVNLTQLEVFG